MEWIIGLILCALCVINVAYLIALLKSGGMYGIGHPPPPPPPQGRKPMAPPRKP